MILEPLTSTVRDPLQASLNWDLTSRLNSQVTVNVRTHLYESMYFTVGSGTVDRIGFTVHECQKGKI